MPPEFDSTYEERVAIMVVDGKIPLHEAQRLAKERPWENDRSWGLPSPQQLKLL